MSATVEERMKVARLAMGLDQKQLSEATGISRAIICRAEAGKLRLSGPNRDRVEAWLAKALWVSA